MWVGRRRGSKRTRSSGYHIRMVATGCADNDNHCSADHDDNHSFRTATTGADHPDRRVCSRGSVGPVGLAVECVDCPGRRRRRRSDSADRRCRSGSIQRSRYFSDDYDCGVHWSTADQLWLLGPNRMIRLDSTASSWSENCHRSDGNRSNPSRHSCSPEVSARVLSVNCLPSVQVPEGHIAVFRIPALGRIDTRHRRTSV